MSSRSPSPSPSDKKVTDLSGNTTKSGKRFMNGWSKEQDTLMSEWSDMAGCYRWMHDRAEKQYYTKNMGMTIPVIILSTITGTASVGLSSIAGDNPDIQKYMNFGIGGVSLIAGILTTLNNFLRYAQLSESNRVAGVAWGKFQRFVAIELAQNPMDRMDSLDFLKVCRAELDRLIEQSPPIPDSIIAEFEKEFKDRPKLHRPDICHGLDHTRVYDSSKTRLNDMIAEATLHLKHKKNLLRHEIMPDLDRIIEAKIDQKEKDKPVSPKNPSGTMLIGDEIAFRAMLEKRRKAAQNTYIAQPEEVAIPVDNSSVSVVIGESVKT